MKSGVCLVLVAFLGLTGCGAAPKGGVNHASKDALSTRHAPAGDTLSSGWTEVGRSVQGRVIEAVTVGGGGRRVLVIGGIHGNEDEGQAAIDALVDAMRTAPARVRIIRDMNPDGTAARTRGNAHAVDFNRNWPATSFRPGSGRGPRPLSEPETAAVAADIQRFSPEVVVVFHSTGRGPFVNFDGPAADLASAFARAAARTDDRWLVVSDMAYATPGSLGSFVGVDHGVSILTIEFDRAERAERVIEAALAGMRAIVAPRNQEVRR